MEQLLVDFAQTLVAIGVAYGLMTRIRGDVKKEIDKNRSYTEAQVVRANGLPLALIDSSPIPKWAKSVDGRMKLINRAYEETFKIKSEEYVGRYDHEVWPKYVALAFAAHDREVLASGKVVEFIERVPKDPKDPDSETIDLWVQKHPIWDASRTEIVAIGGRCMDMELFRKFERGMVRLETEHTQEFVNGISLGPTAKGSQEDSG